jgi:hypothetical protein
LNGKSIVTGAAKSVITILFLSTAIASFFAASVLLFAANIAHAPSKSALRTGLLPNPAHTL